MTSATARPARETSYDNPDLCAPARQLTIPGPLALSCGSVLSGYRIAFETYGTLSPDRDNAVLVCHSLTKGAHAAGRHPEAPQAKGWWDEAIGPGRLIDTNRYFVISGPASRDPDTGRPYGLRFPVVTVRDMAAAQAQMLDLLKIDSLSLAIGGCFGGQQVLHLAIDHPLRVRKAVVITTTPSTSAHSIAIFAVMRHLIRSDPDWRGGDYYDGPFPIQGLNAAIAAAIPLWMSKETMDVRFGRARTDSSAGYSLGDVFAVEQFIRSLSSHIRPAIDPDSLIYLTRAVEYFDLAADYGDLETALSNIRARTMFVSYRGDWRYPAAETATMNRLMTDAGLDSSHVIVDSATGHGGFLFDVGGLSRALSGFLAS
jgi:homoserine O-acetyltransferase